ncbi:MAG TPA: hypothetical protein VFU58_01840 [Candidatus Nitrosotalea sp.]|nr:hypothetical protein [Candidatus Nitrosotalea sp.]
MLRSLFDLGVDHIIMINENGRAEEILSRSTINLSSQKQEILHMSFRLHHSLLQDFDEEYGKVDYLVVERENVKLLSVPFYSYKLLSMMKKGIDHMQIIKKIQHIVNLKYEYPPKSILCEAIENVK